MIIKLEAVHKIYNPGRANQVQALSDVNFEVEKNEIICLQGPSGSGKSTLLSIIGCISQPTSGKAIINGKPISRLPDRFLTLHRRKTIGFIFQHFNILPALSVIENITLPLLPLGISPKQRYMQAEKLMEQLSILKRKDFPAGQISGGELQRVAIARALINNQPLILADEPTAHLDSRLSKELMTILVSLKEQGKTIIITSHDPVITEHPEIKRIIKINDGRINAA
jgi:putative ABC transport system ATP-binding protein